MKRSCTVLKSLNFLRISLGFVFVSILVPIYQGNVKAVRISEEEVVGKPAPEEMEPVEKKGVVPPAPKPPVEEKRKPPPKEEAEPAPPVRKPPLKKEPKPSVRAEAKPAAPPERPVPKKEKREKQFVTIDFDNVDILLFIKFISEATGENFVVDDKVRGKVTVISPTKISVDEAYKVFESVLEVHDFTIVPAGNITKIVPSVVARGKSIETRLEEEAITPEDKVVTQVIRLDYANPDELQKLFRPLISKSSVIVSYAPTGMLIVTDVLSNIKRLIRIIRTIDVAGIGEEISVIPLEHATASELIKPITTVFQVGRTRRVPARRGKPAAVEAPTVKIVADERTNSLVMSASEHDTVRIKQLIKILDQEMPRGKGNIRVYYLQHADAEELAKVLAALPAKEKTAARKGTAPVISKEVEIVADKATNSLVITATKEDYTALVDVIKKLDIPRSMVYIEALIMEVKASKEFTIGVEWRAADDVGTYEGRTVGAFGGSVPSTSTMIPTTPALPPGLSLGILGEAITIGGVQFPTIGAVAQAFRSDSDVHILQTPQILTTDNEEAEIKVADNVPYLSKSSAGETQYNVYEYKDVGLTLKITPQINQERFIRLKIFQEYSTLAPGSAGTEDTPSTLKRTADTTVVVKDEQTLVIGGLVGDQISRGTSGVPCLGNIPALGWLFKSYSDTQSKTNLFIFLTPHVLENPTEAKEIYEEKKEHIEKVEEGVIKMYERPLPGIPEPENE